MDKTKLTKVWQCPNYFMAFGLGTGLLPIAPGTWGTLIGVLLVVMLSPVSAGWYLLLTLLAFIYGCVICDKVSKDLGVHDYSGIVWDEVVGYLLTLYLVPVTAMNLLLGFILFRIFDILKPFPIRWVDSKVEGGFGIMLDDVLAALPACLILHAFVWVTR